ncbi:MAG: AbrB/MazE/SpoVT family DNA-binding domain-containing protein [Deltaproteobacteria bacterium]|nr:AbrB/MazE/SpoVT family DNA-binding domain-containing protein [Deltaproteobacteria bacterium]
MKKKKTAKGCCGTGSSTISNYRVDSIISIDGRGQTVLPKELREKAGIRPGDKLAVTILEKDGLVCCINLIKLDDLMDILKDRLGPVMKEMA